MRRGTMESIVDVPFEHLIKAKNSMCIRSEPWPQT
jgi:hypothetical protein